MALSIKTGIWRFVIGKRRKVDGEARVAAFEMKL